MAIAYVSSVSARSASATTITTAGLNTTSGNLIVRNSAWASAGTFSSVSDSLTNTWNESVPQVNGTNIEIRQDYNANITGGVGQTFTLTLTGNAVIICSAIQISGHDSNPLDQIASGTTASGTSHSTPATSTTTVANEILIGAAGGAGTYSVSAPWTQAQAQTNFVDAYQNVTATGTYDFDYTSGSNTSTAGLISTWKEAAAGGGTFIPIIGRGPGLSLASGRGLAA